MADRVRTMPLDWEDLRYFTELARSGTLSAAARALKVHHATVSRRLERLEAMLGASLFDRRAHGYVLTAEGEAVLGEALAMREAAETIRSRRGDDAGIGGLVRLTATRTLADMWLVPRLEGLHRRHPALDLELLTDSRNMSLAWREADIALRLRRPGDGDLVARRVAVLGFGCYSSPQTAERLRAGEEPAFVGYDDDPNPEAAWLRGVVKGRRIAFRSNSQFSQLAAAQAGFGVAILPHYLAAGRPGLVPVRLDLQPPEREVWMLVRRDLSRTPRIRAVIDHLIEAFEADRSSLLGCR
ncbi:LysR family transcriptional regulator [Arenibaculum sp.]|uniref:LysR family transcriptional regulator n=1 Tax=Arenibaculum sp. TaxID=2865862 RepID=UPI002E0FF7C4|nr:LysR family transcriptional regulator [Arenibaculum sp.]